MSNDVRVTEFAKASDSWSDACVKFCVILVISLGSDCAGVSVNGTATIYAADVDYASVTVTQL